MTVHEQYFRDSMHTPWVDTFAIPILDQEVFKHTWAIQMLIENLRRSRIKIDLLQEHPGLRDAHLKANKRSV